MNSTRSSMQSKVGNCEKFTYSHLVHHQNRATLKGSIHCQYSGRLVYGSRWEVGKYWYRLVYREKEGCIRQAVRVYVKTSTDDRHRAPTDPAGPHRPCPSALTTSQSPKDSPLGNKKGTTCPPLNGKSLSFSLVGTMNLTATLSYHLV